MKRIRFCLMGLLLLLCSMAYPQTFAPLNITVETENGVLSNPWGGGLNCPQLSEADLNRDGVNDLYVFDRVSNLHMAYVRKGNQYVFAPELVQFFPKLYEWCMLRDYNGDGIADIIAYSDVIGIDGLTVYTGYWQDKQLAFRRYPFKGPFDLAYFPLRVGGNTQIYISRIDIPAIDDVDCDSDLDILTFNLSGGYIEFYQNMSVERGYKRDSLVFILQDNCWGGVYEDGFSANMNLAAGPGQCFKSTNLAVDFRHAGSTLTTSDIDKDGDLDLFVGDVSFNNINLLTNGGTCKQAWFNKQDPRFPGNDKGVDLPIFPAVFMIDINNDGKKEVLVAPNENNSSEDVNVLWLYENAGTSQKPEFKFKQDNFLVQDMIDLGTGAYPTFVDFNADGLMDLVVGNGVRFLPQGQRSIGLALWQNVGTRQTPSYKLINRDWLGMNQFNRENFALSPVFGDLDGDNDLDILVGTEFGTLYYAENIAGAGKPLQFGQWQSKYMDIDIGQGAIPQIVDLDGDKLLDLVIGTRPGFVSFFRNTGTAQQAKFSKDPTLRQLGRVDGRAKDDFINAYGYSAPLFFTQNQSLRLLLGTERGELKLYDNIERFRTDTFRLIDANLGKLQLGMRTKADLADLNGDGFLDMVVGNQRGGLNMYSTPYRSSQTTPVREPLANQALELVPNPASDWVNIPGMGGDQHGMLSVFDAAGRQILQQKTDAFNQQVPVRDWIPGVYIFRLSTAGQVFTGRLVKK